MRKLEILAANRLDATVVVIEFSDGTSVMYTAEQLAAFALERVKTDYQQSQLRDSKNFDEPSVN